MNTIWGRQTIQPVCLYYPFFRLPTVQGSCARAEVANTYPYSFVQRSKHLPYGRRDRLALEGLHASDGRYGYASRLLIIATGCAIATDGQGIVSTIVSLNVVYVSAVGLLFLFHESRRRVAPRCASAMLLSGTTVSLLVSAMNWAGIGHLPAWLPLPAGLFASARVPVAWQFAPLLGRVRP
ncbi:hypothetical protein AB3X85_29065 [Paraburkholderia phenoliruptrix]|uniref:hypothetical protein n=1 Tax=Paraburkholderia phenoliruptrix TaxID=252970 RepID=UPI0034CDEB7D